VQVGLPHFLLLSAGLFSIGVYGILARRHAVALLLSAELLLSGANIALVAFARFAYQAAQPLAGQALAAFVIAVAAGELAVGIAILLLLYRQRETLSVDALNLMKG